MSSNRSPHINSSKASQNRTGAGRKRRKKATRPKASKIIIKRMRVLFRKLMRTPIVPIAAGILIIAVLGSWLFWLFTNKNGYEVFVDDRSVGIVAVNKKKQVAAEDLYATALSRIVQEAGANVEVKEEVTGQLVHAKKGDIKSIDFVTDEIYKRLSYKIEAAVLKVDGIEICIVKNENEAKSIQEKIFDNYIEEGAEAESSFVEEFTIEKRFVEKGDVISEERAYTKLMTVSQVQQSYTVKDGDNLWSIYTRNGMTERQIKEINPGLTEKLKAGQQIYLLIDKPLLSVKTIEKQTYPTVEKMKTVTRENSARTKSYNKVEQYGSDGEKEVTVSITKINGVEVSREEISEKITIQPVDEIIEVGTR